LVSSSLPIISGHAVVASFNIGGELLQENYSKRVGGVLERGQRNRVDKRVTMSSRKVKTAAV